MKREANFEKKRQTRSDKKHEIQPTVHADLKATVQRLSELTDTPIKDVAEVICQKGLASRKVIDCLSSYFRKDFRFANTVYFGFETNECLQRKFQSGKNVRLTVRFQQSTYNRILDLAYALTVTPSKATALLLDYSIRNTNILNAYVRLHLQNELTADDMKLLKKIHKFINNNNPYDEEVSWIRLLYIIFEDMKGNTQNVKKTISEWIERYK